MSSDPILNPSLDATALTDADWSKILDPAEFHVLRQSGTERAGTGRYLNEERSGAYHCAGCGQKLYDGEHKFHSGCGWPSFNQEAVEGAITRHTDQSWGMTRTEMRCSRCAGHLGHIFNDAPHQPTGMRHCVNGTALVFVAEGEDVQTALKRHRR